MMKKSMRPSPKPHPRHSHTQPQIIVLLLLLLLLIPGNGAQAQSASRGERILPAPQVVSVLGTGILQTSDETVQFVVTFSESVSGVDASDFFLTTTGDLTGFSIANVENTLLGLVYTVTVDTGVGEGTLRLDVIDNNSIVGAISHLALGGVLLGDGAYLLGDLFSILRPIPDVLSIARIGGNPTNAATIKYLVTFSEAVTGVDASDFDLVVGGGVVGASIDSVSDNGDGIHYTVTVNAGVGTGTIELDLLDDNTIVGVALDILLGGPLLGDGGFAGQVFDLLRAIPSVVDIDCFGGAAAGSVAFLVTFSEAVTGVDLTDFSITVDGTIVGASITSVVDTGEGVSFIVTVDAGAGDGTIQLRLLDDNSIVGSLLGILLGGPDPGDGDFSGSTCDLESLLPEVLSIVNLGANPAVAASITLLVTFNQEVDGVDVTDFQLNVEGSLVGAAIDGVVDVGGNGIAFVVTITTGEGEGTIQLELIDDNTIVDVIIGLELGGPIAGDGGLLGPIINVVRPIPVVEGIESLSPSPTSASEIGFRVTFSRAVSGVDTSDFELVTTGSLSGVSVTNVSDNGDGTVWVATVGTGTGSGSIQFNVNDDNSIEDVVTHILFGGALIDDGDVEGPTVVINRGSPGATITLLDPTPTNLDLIRIGVDFDEPVAPTFTADDIAVIGMLAGGASVDVTGTDPNFVVEITPNDADGEGTVGIAIGTEVTDTGGNAFPGAISELYTIDNTAPTATITLVGPAITDADELSILVDFSESVGTSFTTADITAIGSLASGAGIALTPVPPDNYLVTITPSDPDADGTIGISIGTNVEDLAGNGFAGGDSDLFQIDNTLLVATITLADANPTRADSVRFDIAWSFDVVGTFTEADLSLTGTLSGNSTFVLSGAGTAFSVVVTPDDPDADGTLGIAIGTEVTDADASPFGGVVSSELYLLDQTPPTTEATAPSGTFTATNPTVEIGFTADDGDGSGVATVHLFWRRGSSGDFVEWGAGFPPDAPIPFDIRIAGHSGVYEFYTIGVDVVGNVEEAPAVADTMADITYDPAAPTTDVISVF